jgi:hypothetical protein
MFAATAALNKRNTTLNPTTSGICLMTGLPVTNARCFRAMYAEGSSESRKSAGPKPRALIRHRLSRLACVATACFARLRSLLVRLDICPPSVAIEPSTTAEGDIWPSRCRLRLRRRRRRPYGLRDSGFLIAPLPHPTGRDSLLLSLARPLVRFGLLQHLNCLRAGERIHDSLMAAASFRSGLPLRAIER